MTDRDEKVREALERIEGIAATINHAGLYTAEHAMEDLKAIRLTALNALAALSRPAPDVPSADEVEAIRARHEAATAGGWCDPDRATLLRLLDAARAELAEERARIERLTDALDEIAAHYNGGITGPGRQQADSMREIARAALAKDPPLGDGP